MLAARALFPRHNDGLHYRLLEFLLSRSTAGEGWVSRQEILALWGEKPARNADAEKHATKRVTNTLSRLEQQIARHLAWVVPHLSLKILRRPPNHASHFRIEIRKKSSPWIFKHNEMVDQPLPTQFVYRFNGGDARTAHVRIWAFATRECSLMIEAVRESPDAEWQASSHIKSYLKARDAFFEKEVARAKKEGRADLHDSDLWGIRDIDINPGEGNATVRITTTRTNYSDLHFLKQHLDTHFPATLKHTYRQWLKLQSDPRADFCPPRDALCVYVLVFTRKPSLTVFLAKQKHTGKWEASAAGAACSTHYNVADHTPDLLNQVCGVLHKETGLKTSKEEVRWLGLARGVTGNCSTSVLALVETKDDVAQVLHRFKRRREKDDVEELKNVSLVKAQTWLDTIPPEQRGEFLELSLALAAIDQKLASPQ